MTIPRGDYASVSLLITHYNRSKSLARLLDSIKQTGINFAEIVVSDDRSKPEHLNYLNALKEQYGFSLLTAPINRGLANNLNKGQLHIKTPYTLYVQEDFVPLAGFKQAFDDALDLMEEDLSIDIARFYAYGNYPYMKPYKRNFLSMHYKPWYTDTNKIYQYSDHPHLRRSTFLNKFGLYVEGIKSDKTEYRMCISFIKKEGKGIFYRDYKALFSQENSSDEPSTVKREAWRQSNNFFISVVRKLYRQIKYNYDIHISNKI